MRKVDVARISEEVARLCQDSNYYLGEDIIKAFEKGVKEEESPAGKAIFEQLLENAQISREEQVPMCQDTGFAVFFLELGQEVELTGGSLDEAVNAGVKKGYTEGYLRKSIVEDPLRRKNTGDNTPAILHTHIVPGDQVKITIAPKGGGSENMSRVGMLKPADGREGVKQFAINTAVEAGPNPCPPIVVGVGIGGTFEKVAYLAKKALLRPIHMAHPDPYLAELEEEILEGINQSGVGPQGLGGRFTALGVNIEVFPAHIASLPVAVNINCHASRHKSVVI